MFRPSWATTVFAPLVVRRIAPDGDEPVALGLDVRLVGVHAVEVLRVRLDLVVEGGRNAGALQVTDDVLDDPGAAEAGGDAQDMLAP